MLCFHLIRKKTLRHLQTVQAIEQQINHLVLVGVTNLLNKSTVGLSTINWLHSFSHTESDIWSLSSMYLKMFHTEFRTLLPEWLGLLGKQYPQGMTLGRWDVDGPKWIPTFYYY